MKIKLFNWLLVIDILTIFLILAITFVPSNPVRIVLGLPFLLFFPGYALIEALFVRRNGTFSPSPSLSGTQGVPAILIPAGGSRYGRGKEEREGEKGENGKGGGEKETGFRIRSGMESNKGGMDGIERVALSFGMSIAVSALIGLGLNYTPWGIRLEPVLYSISAFIIIMSAIALFRQHQFGQLRLVNEYHIRIPGWEGSAFNKTLTVILSLAILGAVGTLIFVVASPKVGERFTEFYLLGQQGKADDYPAEFVWQGGQVTGVRYGDSTAIIAGNAGQVTLGIVNHEQQKTTYSVALQIDGQPVNMSYNGQSLPRLEGITLEQEGKWEGLIRFAPLHTGQDQKVEFFLYKDGAAEAYLDVHLYVNVIQE